MVANWKKQFFSDTEISQLLKERLKAKQAKSTRSADIPEPYLCDTVAGAFFVFTSNVDAHSFDHFDACEVRECHGNIELWQCSRPLEKPCPHIWRAPIGLEFSVDLNTMLAAASLAAAPPATETDE